MAIAVSTVRQDRQASLRGDIIIRGEMKSIEDRVCCEYLKASPTQSTTGRPHYHLEAYLGRGRSRGGLSRTSTKDTHPLL